MILSERYERPFEPCPHEDGLPKVQTSEPIDKDTLGSKLTTPQLVEVATFRGFII